VERDGGGGFGDSGVNIAKILYQLGLAVYDAPALLALAAFRAQPCPFGMFAFAVAAEMGGGGFCSGAAPRFMLFST
jgi:hypothetical protein